MKIVRAWKSVFNYWGVSGSPPLSQKMDFTFGIITAGGNDNMLTEIILSIEKQNIPNYEIIIVGDTAIKRNHCIVIAFDESLRSGWITKKKNIITKAAHYENIVYLHDYISFDDVWYEGQLKAGSDYKVRMDKIINLNGERYRDWCIWPHNENFMDALIGRDCLIPYTMTHLSKFMYISGAYWIAKKSVMTEFPLNEELSWAQGEDVVWSKIVRAKYNFNMNPYSSVRIMRPNKDRVFNEPDTCKLIRLNTIASIRILYCYIHSRYQRVKFRWNYRRQGS